MDLYILRHGKAEPYGQGYPSDHLRPLTPKGRKRTKLSVKGMKTANVDVDLIVSSPILRARQTAEIVHKGLGLVEPIEFSDTLASGSVTGIVSAVEAHSSLNGVMLVGHEPTLSELISTMASGTYQTALNLKPGGLCKLNVTAIRLGQCATIEWFVTPKQLVAMS
jgi:phosphohistidine phosphatase